MTQKQKQLIEKYIRTQVKKRLNEANQTSEYKKLKQYLVLAAQISEKVFEQGEDDTLWNGNEGNEITDLLIKIWSGFSTGNVNDHSANDEIFK